MRFQTARRNLQDDDPIKEKLAVIDAKPRQEKWKLLREFRAQWVAAGENMNEVRRSITDSLSKKKTISVETLTFHQIVAREGGNIKAAKNLVAFCKQPQHKHMRKWDEIRQCWRYEYETLQRQLIGEHSRVVLPDEPQSEQPKPKKPQVVQAALPWEEPKHDEDEQEDGEDEAREAPPGDQGGEGEPAEQGGQSTGKRRRSTGPGTQRELKRRQIVKAEKALGLLKRLSKKIGAEPDALTALREALGLPSEID